MRRPASRPFYPCQVPTGETYVLDGRTSKVASTVFCDFDPVGRWRIAVQRADAMNDAFETRFFVRRRWIWLIAGLAIIALAIWAAFQR